MSECSKSIHFTRKIILLLIKVISMRIKNEFEGKKQLLFLSLSLFKRSSRKKRQGFEVKRF